MGLCAGAWTQWCCSNSSFTSYQPELDLPQYSLGTLDCGSSFLILAAGGRWTRWEKSLWLTVTACLDTTLFQNSPSSSEYCMETGLQDLKSGTVLTDSDSVSSFIEKYLTRLFKSFKDFMKLVWGLNHQNVNYLTKSSFLDMPFDKMVLLQTQLIKALKEWKKPRNRCSKLLICSNYYQTHVDIYM